MRFADQYYPDIEDITPEQLAAARATVVAMLSPAFSDVDLAPGSPTGDLVVGPLAQFFATNDEANSRLMSDLDLDNVANNVIYSCDFVRRYLGNFAVYDVDNAKASGVARFTFSSDESRTIELHTLFRFGTEDDFKIRRNGSESTVIQILPSGHQPTDAPDTYILSQTSGTTWAVDLPVEGVMSSQISRGTTGTMTVIPSGLVGLAAAMDFLPGVASASLPELAKMARRMAFALNAGSRNSTASMVLRNWPESNMVSPVITGDTEMLRTAHISGTLFQEPAVDIYYRSARDLQEETQVFRLDYVEVTDGGGTSMRFRGRIPFLHTPSKIIDIQWAGSTTSSLIDDYEVYSFSARQDMNIADVFGSRHERFYADITPVFDLVTDEPLIPRITDGTGTYALFRVTYLADPMLGVVAAALESEDATPPGVSVLVKGGPLVEVKSLSVIFQKAVGVKTLTTPAAERIGTALNTSGYPEIFKQTAIHDAMRIAGALRVNEIACTAEITATAATRIMAPFVDPDDADATADWPLMSGERTKITTAAPSLMPNTVVATEHQSGTWLETWAATPRTVRHLIDPSIISFTGILM